MVCATDVCVCVYVCVCVCVYHCVGLLAGGGTRAMDKHRARGKLFVRDRIDTLLDVGSPFLEIGSLAGYHLYSDDVPSGGVVTGIGRVEGYVCVCVCV
ncbi:MAG: carboxyl transferase domain-containing protein [Terracidiphilus sp.]|nr:carboxyl transferase domain-containing protein [Terracidiphilus sp.]